MPHAIITKNLSVAIGRLQVLGTVTLAVPEGRISGFIGPSGAGKTTLIRTIVGRLRQTSGEVTVLGLPAGSVALRHRLSYMPQDLSVYSDLTAEENVRYFARQLGFSGVAAKTASRRVLGQVGLQDKAGVLVSDLSGGQQRRVSLAAALLGDPQLLVLDEPTVGLDPVLREELWKLFQQLAAAGKTIIISSHVMDEAERCDELVLIRDGAVIAQGSPHELCKSTGSKTVEQSFLKLAGGNA